MQTSGNRYCVYEPIRPRIDEMRVILVDDLIKREEDFSPIARQEPKFNSKRWIQQERHIAKLAMANIEGNVRRLISRPKIETVHFAELSESLVKDFDPDAIVLSGTLRDFDFYPTEQIDAFNSFITSNRVPVLAICGGHQLF